MPFLLLGLALLRQPSPDGAPAGRDIEWRNVGPGGGGWIQSIACGPARSNVLHVGCDVGGYYRSNDGGLTYQIRNEGLRDYFIECIAVSAHDPSTILLGAEGGIYKSTDDGQTWRWMREGLPPAQRYSLSAPVASLAFDPTSAGHVYAGIGRPRWGRDGKGQVYRSTDLGESWEPCGEGLPEDAIVSDLEHGDVEGGPYLLAATDRGLFRSDSLERGWQRAEGLPHEYVEELAIAPSRPNVAYATLRTTARDDQPWNGGVLRSDDSGRTWELRAEGLPQRVGKSTEPAPMTSSCKEIVVDPWDEDVAYVGDTSWVSAGVYKTTNGGLHWDRSAFRTRDESSFTDYGWITNWGPSVKCLTISPVDRGRLYFGTSGHVFTTGDGGETWDQRYCRTYEDGRFAGTGLEVTCLFDAVLDPHQEGRIYFCYFDIGLLISEDGGQTFRRAVEGMKNSGNCFTVVPDPEEAGTVWATTGQWGSNHGDVCRSGDRGLTWEVVGKPESGLPDGQTKVLRLDPSSPVGRRHLYVTCRGHGVYRGLDGGEAWECINGNLTSEVAGQVRGLVLDPADAKHIRIAIGGSPANGAGIYETVDGGGTWRKVNESLEFGDIQDFDADPTRFDTLYVCQRELYDRAVEPPVSRPGGLFKSTDGGVTWRQAFSYHFTHRLTISPLDASVLYLGTTDHPYHDDSIAAGVFKSEDGGATWQSENAGLTSLSISCIAVRPSDDGRARLVVGTGGNGAFVGADQSPLP
jgi:photosystem II stability/assembly factor-like uncharacterized protein